MAIGMVRTLILFFFTVLAVRLMGKRQLGEMEPTEFVVTLLISDLATLSMQDPENPLLNSVVPILTLVIAEVLLSALTMKFPRLREFFTGRYSVIVDRGVIDQKEMAKAQLTVSELWEEVRQHGLASLSEVKFCVMENDGKVSVIPTDDPTPALPVLFIADGVPIRRNLRREGISNALLRQVIAEHGCDDPSQVFLLYRQEGRFICVRKEKK